MEPRGEAAHLVGVVLQVGDVEKKLAALVHWGDREHVPKGVAGYPAAIVDTSTLQERCKRAPDIASIVRGWEDRPA